MAEKRQIVLIWIVRLLVGAVTLMNLQAAFQFMLRPWDYASGFELAGVAGDAMIRGMGLLFLMWNVPYIFAAIQPQKYQVALVCAVVMQFIGVVGETLILSTIPLEHTLIHSSVTRFILFDGSGLIVLLIALALVSLSTTSKKSAAFNA